MYPKNNEQNNDSSANSRNFCDTFFFRLVFLKPMSKKHKM